MKNIINCKIDFIYIDKKLDLQKYSFKHHDMRILILGLWYPKMPILLY
jgi:hypothetical protein